MLDTMEQYRSTQQLACVTRALRLGAHPDQHECWKRDCVTRENRRLGFPNRCVTGLNPINLSTGLACPVRVGSEVVGCNAFWQKPCICRDSPHPRHEQPFARSHPSQFARLPPLASLRCELALSCALLFSILLYHLASVILICWFRVFVARNPNVPVAPQHSARADGIIRQFERLRECLVHWLDHSREKLYGSRELASECVRPLGAAASPACFFPKLDALNSRRYKVVDRLNYLLESWVPRTWRESPHPDAALRDAMPLGCLCIQLCGESRPSERGFVQTKEECATRSAHIRFAGAFHLSPFRYPRNAPCPTAACNCIMLLNRLVGRQVYVTRRAAQSSSPVHMCCICLGFVRPDCIARNARVLTFESAEQFPLCPTACQVLSSVLLGALVSVCVVLRHFVPSSSFI